MQNKSLRGSTEFARPFRCILGFMAYANIAWAQGGPQGTTEYASSNYIEEVRVTASRITREGFDAPTPTTMITADDFERQALLNVGDAVNKLPSNVPTETQQSSVINTPGPGNFMNLRGIGATRTLTLVNGRRHVPTRTDGTVNTNLIPTILIGRIEVVTGGASAAWGSDAVAGVVNYVFDDNFTGLKADASSGISQEGDNEQYRVSLAYGTRFADDKGHFSIAAEHSDSKGIRYQKDRDWGAPGWGLVANPGYVPGSDQFSRIGVPDARIGIATEGGLILSGSLAANHFDPNGKLVPFNPGSNPFQLKTQGGDGALWGPMAPLLVPLERSNMFATGSYQFGNSIEAFTELSYSEQIARNRNVVQPFSLGNIFITADNAFLAPDLRNQLLTNNEPGFAMGRLHTDIGFTQGLADSDTVRAVAGARGRMSERLGWEAYYQYGRSRQHNSSPNSLVTNRFFLATDAVTDPGTGEPVCRSSLTDPGNGCVPINLFGFGAPSAEAIGYVTGTTEAASTYKQHVFAASLQGDGFDLGAGPVAYALGGEYRTDDVNQTADEIAQANGYQIGNPQPFSGDIDVREGFAEVLVPLLKDRAFSNYLDVNAAVRFTDYSTTGSVESWKLGGTWSPVEDLSFRATRSRDIRAPNISELFAISGLSFSNVFDPVIGGTVLVGSPAVANPQLTPEKGNTTTFGFVFKPHRLSGFQMSIDYFDIEVDGVISTLSTQNIVDRCTGGATELCQYIIRDPVTNGITEIQRTQLNLQQFNTSGADVELSYSFETAGGQFDFRLLTTYVDEISIDDGVRSVDGAGALARVGGLIAGSPHWRGLFSAAYDRGPWSLYGRLRYVGSANRNNDPVAEPLGPSRFGSETYASAGASYRFDVRESSVQLFLNVENLTNNNPPIFVDDFVVSKVTDPVFYDVVGRYFTIGARVNFGGGND